MALPVTAVFAGLLALWLIFLQARVVRFRQAAKVLIGSGGDEMGERVIRAHGNAVETVPIFLILLGLAEGLGAPGWVLVLAGMAFLAGRVSHGMNLLGILPGLQFRAIGMGLTVTTTGLLALGVIAHAVMA